jgi:predicted acylesterase/phospholipase RssA
MTNTDEEPSIKRSPWNGFTTRHPILLRLIGLSALAKFSQELALVIAIVWVALWLWRRLEPFGPLAVATFFAPLLWLIAVDDIDNAVNQNALAIIGVFWVIFTLVIKSRLIVRARLLIPMVAVRRPVVTSIVAFLLVWLTISVAQRLRTPTSVQLATPTITEASALPKPRVGLALSGGGYRAAIFHAGVIAALQHFGYAPTHISSVSGGSILAAYIFAGGHVDRFPDLVASGQLRLFARATYADNAVPLLLSLLPSHFVPWARTRTDLQEDILNRTFLHRMSLDALMPDAPKWIIGTTDLHRGWGVGVTRDGWVINPTLRAGERMRFANVDVVEAPARPCFFAADADLLKTQLSRLVVASSAFPVAFNAVHMNGPGSLDLMLADGGVSDNTGMGLLLSAHFISRAAKINRGCGDNIAALREAIRNEGVDMRPTDWQLDLAISSDAGAPIREATDLSWSGQLGQAIDTVYANVGLPLSVTAGAPRTILLNPADLADYDFTRSHSAGFTEVEHAGLTTNDVARIAMSAGFGRKLRLISQLAQLSEPARTFLEETLLPSMDEDLKTHSVGMNSPMLLEDQQLQILYSMLVTRGAITQKNTPKLYLTKHLFRAFELCLQSFLSTGTLEDAIDTDRAYHIFNLGALMVTLNVAALKN